MAKNNDTSKNELFGRLIFLVVALVIYRIGVHIPVPGVDLSKIKTIFDSQDGGVLQYFNMFSGGALSNASLLALGVAPYITASILMQLLAHMYAPLKELRQQGGSGQRKINLYTRYVTLCLAVVQSFAITRVVMAQGMNLTSGFEFMAPAVIGLTSGAMFMMWLGEQITERGVGNGISMLIFAGIAVNMPAGIGQLIEQGRSSGEYAQMFLVLFLIICLFALIVFVERAQRRIPIHNAKSQQFGVRSQGAKSRDYLPMKVNMAGVIPAIFGSVIITLIASGLALLTGIEGIAGRYISDAVQAFQAGQWLYIALFAFLIIMFSFFYTSMMFENRELAENLKKQNTFIQGFRPGKQTSEYLDLVQNRLTFVGALYVAFVCILPSLFTMNNASGHILFLFGGTSLLIAVVVAMDFMSQVQSHLLSSKYKELMKQANLSGFGGQFHR